MDDTTNDVIVGIDLGTTNYSYIIYNNKGPQILENEDPLSRPPCFAFFFSKNDQITGDKAKRLENMYIKNGLYDTKRFLGREYNDEEVQALIPRMRYTVEEDSNKPVFVIKLPESEIRTTPTEICALFLNNIKKDIELKLKHRCKIKAIITVPTNFNPNQQKAILKAATYANVKVLKLMYEPVAVAYCYFSLYREYEEGDMFLVYNLGGSGFNITVVKISHNNFNIVAVSDETKLSGQEFDQVIFNYLWDELNRKHDFSKYPNTDFTPLKHHLQIKSEDIKIQLSKKTTTCLPIYASMTLPFVCSKVDITRSKFEELAKDLLQETVDFVDQCLQKHSLTKFLLKKIILYGGTIKIPKIQNDLSENFGEPPTKIIIFPNTSAAEGAALSAGVL